ncbi:Hypothetical protein DEACI_3198 [Acididesulfobacillus acetoxydans]|uniref:Cytosolic protein n=1 Tax=Acididesulfobacillus acetoxydans TaxID=1561005 RepID=A0A8S0W9E1_9FIRM|nr:DUF6125 family protein [Acididesulfobacillus acetoxydans]CAA7602519.1 Hypothetical protein DEACI_3198 [Acididesulfobacillus acetoxydans]CEJ06530.1 Hypothetical protein DEACI_0978 [Acididesulfobacillus acetoxydans]
MLMTKDDLTRDQALLLLTDLAKRWLAHDGLWFQSIEKARGMDEAIFHDTEAWRKFTVIEANRIKEFMALPENGGLQALERALNFRLYAFINQQEILHPNEKTLILHMTNCRVQSARQRKGLPDFPCKPVGEVEYSLFASTIDSRIKTRCLACPPDPHPAEFFCGWEFTLDE